MVQIGVCCFSVTFYEGLLFTWEEKIGMRSLFSVHVIVTVF
jgi:hypothetical protein